MLKIDFKNSFEICLKFFTSIEEIDGASEAVKDVDEEPNKVYNFFFGNEIGKKILKSGQERSFKEVLLMKIAPYFSTPHQFGPYYQCKI